MVSLHLLASIHFMHKPLAKLYEHSSEVGQNGSRTARSSSHLLTLLTTAPFHCSVCVHLSVCTFARVCVHFLVYICNCVCVCVCVFVMKIASRYVFYFTNKHSWEVYKITYLYRINKKVKKYNGKLNTNAMTCFFTVLRMSVSLTSRVCMHLLVCVCVCVCLCVCETCLY